MANPSNVHIDTYLSGILTGYMTDEFALVQAVPKITSAKDSGKVPKLSDDHYRLDEDVRRYGGSYVRVDYDYSTDSYSAEERGLEFPIDDRFRKQYDDPLDAERDATLVLAHKMNLRLEKAIADVFTATGSYQGTDWYESTAQLWDGTGTPVADALTAINQCISQTGANPMGFYGVCAFNTYKALVTNTDVTSRYTSTVPGAANVANITPQAVANAMGLQGLYVSGAVYNTAAEDATASFSSVYPDDDFVVFARTENPGLLSPNFLALITPSGEGGGQPIIEKYRDESKRSDILRVRNCWDILVMNKKLGYMYQDALTA